MDLLQNRGKNDLLRGRYRLLELVGQGGMGAVYKATDEFLGRNVAIKIFRATAIDPADVRRQEDEVNILASLNHHSLVTLLDAAVDRSDPAEPHIYLVMELIEGDDLRRKLVSGPLPVRQIAQLTYDLAEGLEYMHERGVVHRDVKPANVLLVDYNGDDSRTRAKLTDFGVALLADEARNTADGSATGSAHYMSPEQAQGNPVGPPSDVYALGLVLLECFTSHLAFPGSAVPSALARLMNDPEIPDGVPEEWAQLITAMTARAPEDRPLVPDLVRALRQLIIDADGRHRFDLRAGAADADDEDGRMNAVRRYDLLDTPPDGTFDRITALAARIFDVPIALVSVVDHDRIWFKSKHGLSVDHIDRDAGLCASAILDNEPWVVTDARIDPRALANPLVAGEMGLQFYAGVPLRTRDGYNLGTLCVIDQEPRQFSESETASLEDLAAMVMNELELRLDSRQALLEHLALQD
ncbi:protein kinase domain-containing protein [Cryobacterium arcticum]|uniref:Serine/threonine protein kinase n=1 Tax=Cryobacterium arcticum TaxID=670052 RepID=A0A317ZX13_9MICO|nr:protein kinase [Cryobacterium arcticum]PXA69822.1 serine/threonine protein kinase [Cryobacterium arcticum]